MNYSIVLPTLNENGHIIQLIKSIKRNFKTKKNKYEIIIIDDNSTDGTINTIKNYIKKNSETKLYVRLNQKKNLAKSINLGILKSRYENIIWMDADFQHPPKYIKKMMPKMQNYDVVIFSRFLEKSKRYFEKNIKVKEFNENQSILFNKICNLIFYKDITDYTSGYICIKKKILTNFKLKGFYGEYFLSLIIYCKKNNYRILELPFIEKIRKTGSSKTIGNNKIGYMITCYNYFYSVFKNFILKVL